MTPAAIHLGDRLHVRNLRSGLLLVERLGLALGPLSRARGLLGRPPLTTGEGLLLRPCRGVHSWFMGYPIDVAFLDEAGQVVALRPELRPWRLTPYFGQAYCTLELPAGTLARRDTRSGDRLSFEPTTSRCATSAEIDRG